MGSTIWVVSDSTLEQGDSWDHSAMLEVLEQLDALSISLGVLTVSSFLRSQEYMGNLSAKSIRKRAAWFDARTAIPTFQALFAQISENPQVISANSERFSGTDFHRLLLDELDDCIKKLTHFAATEDPFHICFVS